MSLANAETPAPAPPAPTGAATSPPSGTKWCSGCRRERRVADEWGRNRQRADGLAHRCKECCNGASRTRYQGIVGGVASGAALVPLELFPPAAPGEGIGCLRCRHCSVQMSTNFAGLTPARSTVIFCQRQEAAVDIVWDHCPVADPRPAQPRHLARYWKKHGPLGDQVRHAPALLVEFLKHCWSRWPAADLERVTNWSMAKLEAVVRYHRIGGVHTSNNRLHHMDPRRGRSCFTPAQSAWLLAEYRSDRWPRPYIYRLPSARKAAITRNRNRVLGQVATLGPPWTWHQIQRHLHKLQKAEYRAGKATRQGPWTRRVNQYASVPVTGVRSIRGADGGSP